MNSESKKLKRGLKDLSPLFQKNRVPIPTPTPPASPAVSKPVPQPAMPTVTESRPKSGVQLMSVFCPDMASDGLFLNTYLASRMASPERACSILSLRSNPIGECNASGNSSGQESYGRYVKRFSLSWDQFLNVSQSPLSEKGGLNEDRIVLLDFDYPMVPDAEKIFSVLDKWILIMQPTLESITESYRLIKESQLYRSDTDYFMLYDGSMKDERGEQLYEKMSELVERRLGIQLNWLGYLDLSQETHQIDSNMRLDHLLAPSLHGRTAPEKLALAELAHKIQESQAAVA